MIQAKMAIGMLEQFCITMLKSSFLASFLSFTIKIPTDGSLTSTTSRSPQVNPSKCMDFHSMRINEEDD